MRFVSCLTWIGIMLNSAVCHTQDAESRDSNTASATAIARYDSDSVTGSSRAVVVDRAELVHTTQLLPTDDSGELVSGNLQDQIDCVFSRLRTVMQNVHAAPDRLVKLNCYVADDASRPVIIRTITKHWRGQELPAVAWVQTSLPLSKAQVAVDAVIAVVPTLTETQPAFGRLSEQPPQTADWCVMPTGDAVYVSGQAEKGDLPVATTETLKSLLRTLEHMYLERRHIVGLKCFLQPMAEADVVNRQIAEFFGSDIVPPVSHVEWISSGSPIEIELVAAAPRTSSSDSVTYSAPPWMKTSPVYSRVARIHGDRRIYVAGLYAAENGDGAAQVRSVFDSLEQILKSAGSDFRHLAKATYYVSDDDSSSQLNALRPSLYDPQRPPAASKAMVSGVADDRRTITLDMIAAPAAVPSHPAKK
ncbi:MAG: RidA family protein [Planctomycetaceae bacterium]|nr:RidA family protein [Planctomycetaceae bacterium]